MLKILNLTYFAYAILFYFIKPEKGEHYIYTPLHGWATEMALNDPTMKSAFDFLDPSSKFNINLAWAMFRNEISKPHFRLYTPYAFLHVQSQNASKKGINTKKYIFKNFLYSSLTFVVKNTQK